MSNERPEQKIPEVSLKYSFNPKGLERPLVSTSSTCYEMLREAFEPYMELQETFVVLLLDRGNRAKGWYRASTGGLHGTVADPKLIFAVALKTLSSAIILAHNHPSGQLRPSEEDIRLTRKMVEAGKFLEIAVHDHVIVTTGGYYSFADNGML
ncbi:MAG: JAB domain-containing protein [Flavobacteriales bacterium]|nr:JAB domain-containing protein [Flavobacteriales bacterium]